MQLVFLGTGGSWPSPDRNVSAIAVKKGREVVLFDCGEGTQRQLMISSVSFMQIKRIFITHFHGDHFLGLPGLIQSMSLNNRETPLEIYGPEGTIDLVLTLLDLGYFNSKYVIKVHDICHGDVLDFGDYTVKAVDAAHSVPVLAYCLEEAMRPGKFNKARALELGIPEGKLFSRLQKGETVEVDGKTFTPDMVLGPPRKGLKLVYSGDTGPCDNIRELAKDCDVLIHEATADSSLEEKANEFGHSTARQAAEIAKEAGAKLLILTHISPRYDDSQIVLEDAKSVFENTIVAEDFSEFDIKYSDG
ncbi:MAG: ribonuclease Z [Thermoplasmata archaeon]|nr:ribonuclease Z [Thermoplasmata archaeon]